MRPVLPILTLIAYAFAGWIGAREANALTWPDIPERIERGLASNDPVARRSAARDLSALGPGRGLPLVLRALDDPDTEVRLAAAQSAMRLRVTAATEAVLPWLGGTVSALRVAACEVARAMPNPRAVPQLARALGDPEATVRAAAADALGAYPGDADAVAPLLGRLDDASPPVRIQIARALARLGDARAVVPLVGKAQDSVPEMRQAVARALGELADPRAAQALILQLRDNATEVRVEALGALGRLRAEDAVDAIAPLTLDRNPTLRQAALGALGKIATSAAVRALVATLGYSDDASGTLERTPAREALVLAGSASDPRPRDGTPSPHDGASARDRVASALTAVLDHPTSPAAATSAAWILGVLRAERSALAITAAMRRGVLPVAAALRALGGIGTSESVPIVLEFTSDSNPIVREEALRAASALLDPAHPDGRAVEPLAALLRDARLSATERAQVARLLGRTGASRAAPILASLAIAKDPTVRVAAMDALGTLGPPPPERTRDLDPLLDALGDPDPGVRLHAAGALAEAGDAKVRDALLAKLDKSDEIDRAALLTALGGILSRVPSDAAVARLTQELGLAAGAERDALIEAIGRANLPSATASLANAARSADADDRRSVAAAIAAQASGAKVLRALLVDSDGSVRAQAAWALGAIGGASDLDLLRARMRDDLDVAANSAAALGRIAGRMHPTSSAQLLCTILDDARTVVRANALAGLAAAGARCGDGAAERRALTEDPTTTFAPPLRSRSGALRWATPTSARSNDARYRIAPVRSRSDAARPRPLSRVRTP